MTDIIEVSAYCLAYNHEKYIRDALEGFVKQRTNFKFEVFVHDDASEDHTADIIREYAEAYPDIIKPIYQKENQHSKGIKIVSTYIYPKMKGKYIAICEGDDYWCDAYKLQRQVDFLNSHPSYSACVHNTLQINCRTGKKSLISSRNEDSDLRVEDILQKGNGQFQLSSLVYRKEYFYRPEAFCAQGFGDYPLSIYLSIVGKIRFLKETMSIYRLFSNGSWTSRTYQNGDTSVVATHYAEVNKMLNAVNVYSGGKYHNTIVDVMKRNEMEIMVAKGRGREAIKVYKDCLKQYSKTARIKLYIKIYCPTIFRLYCKMRVR